MGQGSQAPCTGERIQVEVSQVAEVMAGLRSQTRKRGGSRLISGANVTGCRWRAEDSAPQRHGHSKRKKTCQDPAPRERHANPPGEGGTNCPTPTPGGLVKTRHGWRRGERKKPSLREGTKPSLGSVRDPHTPEERRETPSRVGPAVQAELAPLGGSRISEKVPTFRSSEPV